MTINVSSYEEAIEYVKKTHLNNQAFMRRISDIRDQLKGCDHHHTPSWGGRGRSMFLTPKLYRKIDRGLF